MSEERGHLLSRIAEGFDLAEVVSPLVGKQGCITVKTNFYSAGEELMRQIRHKSSEVTLRYHCRPMAQQRDGEGLPFRLQKGRQVVTAAPGP
jgi:hypothetical protein